MPFDRFSSAVRAPSWGRLAAVAVVGAAALVAAGAAQAREDVYWSVGVASPGVQLGVSNSAPRVLVQPAPVYVQPAPVYMQPRPVYMQPAPVYYRPAQPVYRPVQVSYQGAPVVLDGYGAYPRHPHHPHHFRGRDRNHDGIADYRQDFNGDGRPDWTRR